MSTQAELSDSNINGQQQKLEDFAAIDSGEFDAVRARQRAGGVFYAMELGGGLMVDVSTCGS